MTMETRMNLIEINPSSPQVATKSVILLHGLGADGNDFVPIVAELDLLDSLALRFVFPSAPFRPVTINQGYEMRAWYDIYTMQLDARVDLDGINESVAMIDALIEKENKRGIVLNNIILAGFSQGAVIALTTALRYPERLGGCISFVGFSSFC
jgi:phospholipase/carboxylesterase